MKVSNHVQKMLDRNTVVVKEAMSATDSRLGQHTDAIVYAKASVTATALR